MSKPFSSTKAQVLLVAFIAAVLGSVITSLILASPADAKKDNGYQIVTVSVDASDDPQVSATTVCPGGTKVMGGSAEIIPNPLPAEAWIRDIPAIDGSGWTATSNFNQLPYTLKVYAICAET